MTNEAHLHQLNEQKTQIDELYATLNQQKTLDALHALVELPGKHPTPKEFLEKHGVTLPPHTEFSAKDGCAEFCLVYKRNRICVHYQLGDGFGFGGCD